MVQQQWRALERAYELKLTRAIGVSNYCAACLACIMKVAKITPHVNQVTPLLLPPPLLNEVPREVGSVECRSSCTLAWEDPIPEG